MKVTLELSGGLELLFGGTKRWEGDVAAPSDGKTLDVRGLVEWMRGNLLKERPELFVSADGGVRPGILVLINDADWELEGGLEYALQEGDTLAFISTLHGG